MAIFKRTQKVSANKKSEVIKSGKSFGERMHERRMASIQTKTPEYYKTKRTQARMRALTGAAASAAAASASAAESRAKAMANANNSVSIWNRIINGTNESATDNEGSNPVSTTEVAGAGIRS